MAMAQAWGAGRTSPDSSAMGGNIWEDNTSLNLCTKISFFVFLFEPTFNIDDTTCIFPRSWSLKMKKDPPGAMSFLSSSTEGATRSSFLGAVHLFAKDQKVRQFQLSEASSELYHA